MLTTRFNGDRYNLTQPIRDRNFIDSFIWECNKVRNNNMKAESIYKTWYNNTDDHIKKYDIKKLDRRRTCICGVSYIPTQNVGVYHCLRKRTKYMKKNCMHSNKHIGSIVHMRLHYYLSKITNVIQPEVVDSIMIVPCNTTNFPDLLHTMINIYEVKQHIPPHMTKHIKQDMCCIRGCDQSPSHRTYHHITEDTSRVYQIIKPEYLEQKKYRICSHHYYSNLYNKKRNTR